MKTPIEVGCCKMCDSPAVAHSLFCSEGCADAYFDQEPYLDPDTDAYDGTEETEEEDPRSNAFYDDKAGL